MILIDGYKPKFGMFPNNERNLNFNTVQCASNSTITLKYESDQDLMDLFILKTYLDEIMPGNSIGLKILYVPYSRMDRKNDIYTFNLKYITYFINKMKFHFVDIIDAHSDVTSALLNRCTNKTVIPELFKYVESYCEMIVFPDTTAEKRYAKFFQGIPCITASKERDFADGKISKYKIDASSVKDKNVVLIDDLCSRGGTFIAAAKVLREAGAKRIDLIVAHCEENIMNGEIPHSTDGEGIDKVITTNSIITKEWIKFNYNSIYSWLMKEKFIIHEIYEAKKI